MTKASAVTAKHKPLDCGLCRFRALAQKRAEQRWIRLQVWVWVRIHNVHKMFTPFVTGCRACYWEAPGGV